MTPETLTALQQSIAKWERNAVVKRLDGAKLGWKSCALCALFYRHDCEGCPVSERTGEVFCGNSPYDDAEEACFAWKRGYGPREEFHTAARAEVDFLKSLLPESAR